MSTVDLGLGLILNITRYPSLLPALWDRVLHTVIGFTDPATNHTNMVLNAMIITELIHPENTLHNYLYPQVFFEEIESMVARSVYSEEDGDFMFQYRCDNGTHGSSASLLFCMGILGRAPHYMCSLMGVLERQQSQFERFIRTGNESDKKETIELLRTFTTHTCTACVGGQFALSLLLKNGLTSEQPTSPPPGGQKTMLLPSAVIPTKPKLDATVKPCGLPHRPSSSRKCTYLVQCEKFLRSLKLPGMN